MDNLKEAYHEAYTGESKAALRLKIYAKQAEQEGLPAMARLFRVISLSEEIHGERSLRMLRELKGTEDNLKSSFESETRVAGVAYDRFVKLASEQDNKTAMLVFSQSRDVEETHARLYKEAMSHVMEERETKYYVCQVCGYVSDGVWPDTCPVCSAARDQFVEY